MTDDGNDDVLCVYDSNLPKDQLTHCANEDDIADVGMKEEFIKIKKGKLKDSVGKFDKFNREAVKVEVKEKSIEMKSWEDPIGAASNGSIIKEEIFISDDSMDGEITGNIGQSKKIVSTSNSTSNNGHLELVLSSSKRIQTSKSILKQAQIANNQSSDTIHHLILENIGKKCNSKNPANQNSQTILKSNIKVNNSSDVRNRISLLRKNSINKKLFLPNSNNQNTLLKSIVKPTKETEEDMGMKSNQKLDGTISVKPLTSLLTNNSTGTSHVHLKNENSCTLLMPKNIQNQPAINLKGLDKFCGILCAQCKIFWKVKFHSNIKCITCLSTPQLLCAECKQKFCSWDSFEDHLMSTNICDPTLDEKNLLTCELCNFSTRQNYKFYYHLRDNHKKELRLRDIRQYVQDMESGKGRDVNNFDIICEKCGEPEFVPISTKKLYQAFCAKCKMPKRYLCFKCGKRYESRFGMQYHMDHTNICEKYQYDKEVAASEKQVSVYIPSEGRERTLIVNGVLPNKDVRPKRSLLMMPKEKMETNLSQKKVKALHINPNCVTSTDFNDWETLNYLIGVSCAHCKIDIEKAYPPTNLQCLTCKSKIEYRCNMCLETFETWDLVRRHVKIKNDCKKYKLSCKYCNYSTQVSTEYAEHLQTKHGSELQGENIRLLVYKIEREIGRRILPYDRICPECNEPKYSQALKKFNTSCECSSSSSKKYICLNCGEMYDSFNRVKRHSQKCITEKMKLSCNDCDFETFCKRRLSFHIRRSHGESEISQCSNCNRTYGGSKYKLLQHEQRCQTPFTFCHLCSAQFKALSFLARHFQIKHNIIRSKAWLLVRKISESKKKLIKKRMEETDNLRPAIRTSIKEKKVVKKLTEKVSNENCRETQILLFCNTCKTPFERNTFSKRCTACNVSLHVQCKLCSALFNSEEEANLHIKENCKEVVKLSSRPEKEEEDNLAPNDVVMSFDNSEFEELKSDIKIEVIPGIVDLDNHEFIIPDIISEES